MTQNIMIAMPVCDRNKKIDWLTMIAMCGTKLLIPPGLADDSEDKSEWNPNENLRKRGEVHVP